MKKKYIEYLCLGLNTPYIIRKKMNESNLTKTNFSENIMAFRFVEYEFDISKKYKVNQKNTTIWIRAFKKVTLGDLKQRFGNDSTYSQLINLMENNSVNSVCIPKFDMENDNITLEEYMHLKQNDSYASTYSDTVARENDLEKKRVRNLSLSKKM